MDGPTIETFLDAPALASLSKAGRAGIAGLLATPAKGEFFFLLRLVGHSPAHVAAAILEEFARRFPGAAMTEQPPQPRRGDYEWDHLQAMLDRCLEATAEDYGREFWEAMGHVVAALPKNADGVAAGTGMPRRSTGTARLNHVWSFATCKHCWRRVAHNPGVHRKTGSYCFVHNLPAAHPLYRKHSRLARGLRGEQQAVETALAAILRDCRSTAQTHERLMDALTGYGGCLPRLARYLDEAGHDGTPESLLWAFHGPAASITDADYLAGLERYIQSVLDTGNASSPAGFIFSTGELSRAEAWLAVLERDGRWDGKRKIT